MKLHINEVLNISEYKIPKRNIELNDTISEVVGEVFTDLLRKLNFSNDITDLKTKKIELANFINSDDPKYKKIKTLLNSNNLGDIIELISETILEDKEDINIKSDDLEKISEITKYSLDLLKEKLNADIDKFEEITAEKEAKTQALADAGKEIVEAYKSITGENSFDDKKNFPQGSSISSKGSLESLRSAKKQKLSPSTSPLTTSLLNSNNYKDSNNSR